MLLPLLLWVVGRSAACGSRRHPDIVRGFWCARAHHPSRWHRCWEGVRNSDDAASLAHSQPSQSHVASVRARRVHCVICWDAAAGIGIIGTAAPSPLTPACSPVHSWISTALSPHGPSRHSIRGCEAFLCPPPRRGWSPRQSTVSAETHQAPRACRGMQKSSPP